MAEYRACVDSGQCSRPLTQKRNQYCNYDHPEREQHPVNCVDWAQAIEYCATVGGRLPSEAEWERAARAGTTTRYPWGQEVSCREAILDEVSPAASDREPDGCFTDATWPVGSRAPSALGLFDMHGNVGEWTATWYAPDAITALYAQGNLAGPPDGRQRVVRGGCYQFQAIEARSRNRNPIEPAAESEFIGLRPARQLR